MPRAPVQVLVIPYRRCADGGYEFAVFERADGSMWQFIAGGAEDDETPAAAARREAREEAAIPEGLPWLELDATSSIPREVFHNAEHWPSELRAVPEHCFAVDVSGLELELSSEHTAVEWWGYDEACARLTWSSNRDALGELWNRLKSAANLA